MAATPFDESPAGPAPVPPGGPADGAADGSAGGAAGSGFDGLWEALLPVGRDPRTGGYRRYAWGAAERECREWFTAEAGKRGLDTTTDRNGNLWAWWGDPDADGPGVVTGSHLDSVPDGGAYDGALGVASAFAALDRLRAAAFEPSRPLGLVAFAEEEGARFGVACAGSRLLTGALDPDRYAGHVDADGRSYAEAMRDAGHGAAPLGRDDETLQRIGAFVELHVEQGIGLAEAGTAVGVADGIWPHGRWRFAFTGEANHAGTTAPADRRDPMLTYAMTVLAAEKRARLAGARATFGRVEVEPNSTNAIPAAVTGWLDARAPDRGTLTRVLDEIGRQAGERATRDGTALSIRTESATEAVRFDEALRERLTLILGGAPALPTAAGHDAGILAQAGVPAGMLFVRNPGGISHSPHEHADRGDCLAGVEALARVLKGLLTR